MATQYERLKTQLKKKAGRKPLSPEERQRRKEEQQKENRRRTEARRRALLVLQYKHEDEFSEIYADEYKALSRDKRFAKTSQ